MPENPSSSSAGPVVVKTGGGAAVTIAALLALGLALFGLFWVRVLDPDVLLHLRTGRLIVDTGRIPTRDVFSSNALGQPWVTHEWLWQVLTYKVHQAGEWVSLFALRLALVVGALGAFYGLGRLRGAQGWACLLAILLAVGPLASFAEIRPQLFSYLMFGLVLLLLEWSRTRPGLLVLLPPMFALWSNMHGAMLLGFVLIGCAVAEALWDQWRKRDIGARLRWLLVVGVLCVLAGLINPHTYEVYTFPFKVVGHGVFRAQIFEWAPPDLSRPFLPFWILAAAVLLLAAIARKQLRLADWLLLVLFLAAAAGSRRQIPFFALATLPLVTVALQRVAADRPLRKWAMLACIALVPATSYWAYKAAGRVVGTGLAKGRFPEDAATRLAGVISDGAVLNDYNDGGYLIWRAWPGWLVTMDGRADVYGPKLVEQYQQVWSGAPGWQETLQSWNVKAVLGRYEISRVLPKHNLYHELARSGDWASIHWDGTSVLYLRKGRAVEASDHKPYRRLHPGLRWQEIAAMQQTPQDWEALGADLRRSVSDYPENKRAADLERRWRAAENRPRSTHQ